MPVYFVYLLYFCIFLMMYTVAGVWCFALCHAAMPCDSALLLLLLYRVHFIAGDHSK